jgi:hypothetical protein
VGLSGVLVTITDYCDGRNFFSFSLLMPSSHVH